MNPYHRSKAFTLIELSIVLVIIGLLTAGVIAGKHLIRQAKVRSIITDVHEYRSALHAFKNQYAWLPGDLPNANAIWAAANNGDGNSYINYWIPGMCCWNLDREHIAAWEQLALARMIPGDYDGEWDGGTTVTTGKNIPGAKIEGGAYTFRYDDAGVETLYGKVGNLLVFTSIQTNIPTGPILPPQEAHTIDLKIDDGVAFDGDVRGSAGCNGAYGACMSVTDCLDGANDYLLSSVAANCTMSFWMIDT